MNPLLADPSRPQVDADGSLRNPIGGPSVVSLHNDVPVRPDQLVASTTYTSPGFEYLTDEQGLPARVRGVLRIVPRELRVRHEIVQRMVGHLSGGTHGGHIVAVSLGGFASGPNVFPQIGNFNVSAYARLERGWRAGLRAGATVEVDIALTIDADDPFAPSFVISRIGKMARTTSSRWSTKRVLNSPQLRMKPEGSDSPFPGLQPKRSGG